MNIELESFYTSVSKYKFVLARILPFILIVDYIIVITCGKMPHISNGKMECSNQNKHSSTCQVVCMEGFKGGAAGEKLICNEDGEWEWERDIKAQCKS